MTVRDFVLLSRSDRKRLVDRLQAVAGHWREEWLAASAGPLEIDLDDMAAAAEARWRLGVLPDGFAVAAAAEGLLPALVGNSMPAAAAGRSAIESEVEQAALDALIQRLLHEMSPAGRKAAVQCDTRAPGEDMQNRRAGAVWARCRVGGAGVTVVLHPRVTEHLLKAQRKGASRGGGLVAPRRALASQRVALDVRVGAAELTLHELKTLAVGDVIALDRRLEEPAAVHLSNGGILCAGHLGIASGRKAVQLTGVNSTDEV